MPAVLAKRSHWLLEGRMAIAAEGYTQGIGEGWFLEKRFAVKPGYNKVLITCHFGADPGHLRFVWSPQSVLYPREQSQE
jgi:hypothetical protein